MPDAPLPASTKRFLPRGIYGRAALILILPVVVIQLVVSVAFIQRHFDGVTRQMTDSVVREIEFLLRAGSGLTEAEARTEMLAVAGPLDLAIAWGPGPEADRRVFYDFSGRVVIAVLREDLPGLGHVDLSDLGNVRLGIQTPAGAAEVTFSRRRVSAPNPHQLLVLMVATGLLMTLVAFIFLRNQLRPIRRLAIAAEAFGQGRIAVYHPSGATEVRAAGRAFLDMRDRIERQREQRTLMLSGVSHDLRTPLTRLKLGLAMLPEDDDTRAMLRDVDDMQMLTDAFLAYARGIEADETPETVDVAHLAEAIVEDFGRAGGAVTLGAAPVGASVALRPHALRRALGNLVGNGLRYGSQVRLSVLREQGRVVFRVEDDGPGIPLGQRSEALKPFTRLDAARNQDRGSAAGLGLAIAADIARAHGGEVRLGESADLGGLCAEIVLPDRLVGARLAPASAAPAR